MCEHQDQKPLADWVREGAPIWFNSRLMTTKEAGGAGPTGARGQHLALRAQTRGPRPQRERREFSPRCRQPFTVRSQASRLPAGLCAPRHTVTGSAARKGGAPKEVTHGGAGTLLSLGLFICRKAGCGWGCPGRPLPVSAPRQGLLLSLSEATPPSAPQSKVQSPSASRLDPTEGLWSLVSMVPGEGTGPPSQSKPWLFLLGPVVGKGAAARAPSQSPGPGPHPPACGPRGLVG